MRIPSERDAEIQFEGRDLYETEKIKKNFSLKVGSEFGKSLNILTKAYVLTKMINIIIQLLNGCVRQHRGILRTNQN